MIIKKMDSKEEEIAELEALLKGRLTSYQRFLMERELKAIKTGVSEIWGQANVIKYS